MKKRTGWILVGLTLLITFMDITGLPTALFLNLKIQDVEPFYWTLMVNFLLIGGISWAVLHFLCPEFHLGMGASGLKEGLQKYGWPILLITAVSFIGFYVGLFPYEGHPSFLKVLVEGIVYYICVAIVEELYVRGLLLNLLEQWLHKRADRTFLAVVFSSLLFGLGHIPGTLGMPFYVIACKVVWTISMGFFFGMLYKKSGNLWLPIFAHYCINLTALPYCFSTLRGYAPLTLVIVVPAYVILGIYSLAQLDHS